VKTGAKQGEGSGRASWLKADVVSSELTCSMDDSCSASVLRSSASSPNSQSWFFAEPALCTDSSQWLPAHGRYSPLYCRVQHPLLHLCQYSHRSRP